MIRNILVFGTVLFILSGCGKGRTEELPEEPESVEEPVLKLNETEEQYIRKMRDGGGVRIATILYPGAYRVDPDGNESGMHYYLIQRFGELFDLPVKTEFVEFNDFFARDGVVPENVKTDETLFYTPDIFKRNDIIAFDLTQLKWRDRLMRIIPLYPYKVVLVNRRGEEVSHIGQLQKKRFVVYDNTASEVFLENLSDNLGLNFDLAMVPFGGERFNTIIDGEADYTIGDSQSMQYFISSYPELNISFALTGLKMNGWAVAKDNAVLDGIVRKFFVYAEKSGILNDAVREGLGISMDRYYNLINADAPSGPDFSPEELRYLAERRNAGGLSVAIFNGGSVYEQKNDGTFGGLHYYLALSVAQTLKIPVRFTPVEFREFFEKNGEVPEVVKIDDNFSYKPDLLDTHQIYVGNISPLPWREKFLSFVDLFPTRLVFIVNKHSPPIERNTLHKYRFAFIPNSSYEEWLKNNSNYSKLRKIEAATVEDVLRMIRNDEADVSVADANLVLARLNDYPDVMFYPADDYIDNLSWAVSKEDPVLRDILEKSLEYLRRSGLFDIIWEDYYGSPFGTYLDMLTASATQ